MTRLEKELDGLVSSMLFPALRAKTTPNPTYPPYNVAVIDEDHIVLELATAGFKEDELSIIFEGGILKVSGKKEETDLRNYAHKGIGARAFERSFTLSQDVLIDGAEYIDGILSVFFNRIVPEEKKPNVIPIGKRQYLKG